MPRTFPAHPECMHMHSPFDTSSHVVARYAESYSPWTRWTDVSGIPDIFSTSAPSISKKSNEFKNPGEETVGNNPFRLYQMIRSEGIEIPSSCYSEASRTEIPSLERDPLIKRCTLNVTALWLTKLDGKLVGSLPKRDKLNELWTNRRVLSPARLLSLY